ncbi:hypothetical protein [Pelomonas sp. KK5]|uniref:hypothetical protein n=1 Tax=Pelomonas sp. KK5 TaxID=1855730 RepID=UPI00097C414B|nr:hypothetical protein [Pelomonas sp. KK5]
MELDSIIAFITKVVASLGVVGVVSYQLFKHLGAKWLDERFAQKAAALKAAQERSLAELKAEHDRSLRMVQSYIDREIHRARKLYDREFDVLSEAWRLLVRSFNSGVGTAAEMYPDLARYTEAELMRLVEEVQMKHWEIDELRALEGTERTAYYRRWTGFKRWSTYMKEQQEFQEFLLSSGIFMPEGLKARFTALQDMIGNCFAEFRARLEDGTFREFGGVTKLTLEGRVLLSELEQLLHVRLWSASEVGEPAPAA